MSDFNWSEFMAMGGYAVYVWSSWGLTIIAFVLMIVSALNKRKQLHKKFQQQELQAQARLDRTNKR